MNRMPRVAAATVAGLLGVTIAIAPAATEPASAATATLSKSDYYDKTLAMILGQLAGTLTGYEYVHVINPDGSIDKTQPWIAMPDSAYDLLGGTLGGGGVTSEYPHPTRIPSTGVVHSDDDYVMEAFYQHVMDAHGPEATYLDVRNEIIDHDVLSWGGTDYAIRQIRATNAIPNNAGRAEFGNAAHWLSEPYIETEMLGGDYPGMPTSAAAWAGIPQSMTGDLDNLDFGTMWAQAYAEAYFATDARTLLASAASVLPAGSWARAIYDRAVDLYTTDPSDWRWAANQIVAMQREYFHVSEMNIADRVSDINNAFGILAILYGGNDYESTLKIASLAGYDGDCTAATVTGLMGIIKGTAGTPSEVMTRIYDGGDGVIRQVYDYASIRANYPVDTKITDLTALFQANAEDAIVSRGGSVGATNYTIQREGFTAPKPYVSLTNPGFESGTLTGWSTAQSESGQTFLAESQDDIPQYPNSATGAFRGTVVTTTNTASARLYKTVTGLTAGKTYQADAWIRTASGREARLEVSAFDGTGTILSATTTTDAERSFLFEAGVGSPGWVQKSIVFTLPSGYTSAEVGLFVPPTSNAQKWASIDDLIIREVPASYSAGTRYEAESMTLASASTASSGTASGGQYVTGLTSPSSSVTLSYSNATRSEKILRIRYTNTGAAALQRLYVDNQWVANVPYPTTGTYGMFSENLVEVYLPMNAGSRSIKLVPEKGVVALDAIDIAQARTLSNSVTYTTTDPSYIVRNGVYTLTAKHSGHMLSVDSDSITDGANVIQRTATGGQAQQWIFEDAGGGYYHVRNVETGRALDVLSAGTGNGADVVQWSQLSANNQLWRPVYDGNGYFRLEAKHSGRVLDVSGGTTASGGDVVQWSWLGVDNQRWKLDFVPNASQIASGSTYIFTVGHSGKILGTQSGGTANGTKTVQTSFTNASTQKWKIDYLGDNFYKITSVGANKVIASSGSTDGSDIVLATDSGTDAQKWAIWVQWNGAYRFVNKATGLVIDVAGNSGADGAQVWQWPLFDWPGANQDWYLYLLNH